MNELQNLLASGKPLFITIDGFRQAMLAAFPINGKAEGQSGVKAACCFSPEEIAVYLKDHTVYQFETHVALQDILKVLAQDNDTSTVTLTDEFDDEQLPDNSIAYHRVWGTVMADSYYWFSSKQLAADLHAAEANPQISCHFLHINSPGGEAWYLDRLSETLRACQKPILTFYEQMCCSAGYYIGCHGNRIYALTDNDYVGCIGTMCSFYDFEPYFEKLGIKRVEAKATNSDLKNKTFDDLRHGKDEKFVHDILDPLNVQFLAEVRSQRSQLAELPDDAPVLRGETFYTPQAVELGLTDGSHTMQEAIAEAVTMGREYIDANKLKTAIYNIV
ncbi:S49 family peptidase [Hoylesella marshii]|uniref:Peptidase, S49 (Protease IV) family protein n=1 Tax=Hoylesella marshii DSM 16973 = JCM 13450 TaxID=862515 RepID=E0NSV4_9BACT|nr:S49 family peptidase [Hoylesella marshii]EFM01818.1 peptidase, S49 (protease IV) family protein [Hoylesella marshii DSM 16973 = JCM 13450]